MHTHPDCYDLSLATLLLNHALMNITLANPWVGQCPDQKPTCP